MLRRLTNQTLGKQFETRLQHQARLCGLLLLHAGTSVKWLKTGKTIAVKSDLDFKLYDRSGHMACFDAKSFGGAYFTYSDLTPHQVLRAAQYRAWNVNAGFVVLLRELRQVYWFPIDIITKKGRRQRFAPSDGQLLGPENFFHLRLMLQPLIAAANASA